MLVLRIRGGSWSLALATARKLAAEGESEKYHRVERGYGAFSRRFTVPSTVDANRVEASYQDGVLTVKLPRREESKPRQIQINQ